MLANRQNLVNIENSPYFTQRLNEAQLAEARAEAEAKGEAKVRRLNEAQLAEARTEAEAKGEKIGEAKGANQIVKLIKDGYDVDTALRMIVSKFADE
jgi:regulator of protease activity HflC (stomatin/prohibitin superfamily)